MQAPQNVPHQHPTVLIPIPAAPITQTELALLIEMRDLLADMAAQVERAEQSIQLRLESGAAVEAGDHEVELKESCVRSVSLEIS